MRYTNKNNLPDPIVEAIMWAQTRHVNASGAYGSVTELNGPPLIRWLKKNYQDTGQIEVDVSSMVWILDGVFAHELFEKIGGMSATTGRMLEQTMSFKVPVEAVGARSRFVNGDDYVISFTPDLVLNGNELYDYKKTSVYNVEKIVKTGVIKKDWEEQINVYIEGLRRNTELIGAFNPEKAKIVAWMRDWGPRHMAVSTSPFKTISVPVWPRSNTCKHIKNRLKLHADADNIIPGSGEYPEACTREERWHKTFSENVFVAGPRCKGYCPYNVVCPYYQEYMDRKESSSGDE